MTKKNAVLISIVVMGVVGAKFYLDRQAKLAKSRKPSPVKTLPPKLTKYESFKAVAEVMEEEASQKGFKLTEVKKTVSRVHKYSQNTNVVEYVVNKQGWAIGFGDVLLGKVTAKNQELIRGKMLPKKSRLWPSNVIPYYIDPKLANPKRVTETLQSFSERTVIQFVPVTEKGQDGLYFTVGEENCYSYLGKVGKGLQPILLSSGCGQKEITHEIMHALGFIHEHSRVDRDDFIEVLWGNIKPGFESQFAKVPESLIHQYSGSVFNFDHKSIMLYHSENFAKEKGLRTLRSKTSDPLAPSAELSRADVERIYYLYN